jgi:alkylhydroperoxidase family enzyme
VSGRALGITQQMIDAIPNADRSPLFTAEEKAAIAASLELTRTATLSEATFQRIRPFFDDRALIELVVNTSVANLNNRVTDAFVADLEPEA